MTVPPTPPILEHRPTDPHPPERRTRRRLPPTTTRIILLIAAVAAAALVGQLLRGGTSTEPPDLGTPVIEDPAPGEGTTSPAGPPEAVARTAARIEEAVAAEDWERLAELALEGDTAFTATFGEELTTVEDLAAYWEGVAAEEDLPRIVTGLLALPEWAETTVRDGVTGADVTVHVTPRFAHDPSDDARAALEGVLGPAWLEMQIADGRYLGWRIGITAAGDWLLFVQGD